AYRARLPYPENGERELFPGLVPLVLGVAGIAVGANPIALPATIALASAVDLSLGMNGITYRALYRFVPPMRAFRAPARFRAIGGLWLALLGGVAVAGLAHRLTSARSAHVAVGALALLVLIDLHPTLELQPVWNHAPDIYQRIPEP